MGAHGIHRAAVHDDDAVRVLYGGDALGNDDLCRFGYCLLYTSTASGIGLTRVEIERSGLRRPKGRYITLDMPQFAAIDDRNEAYVCLLYTSRCV